ncbi:MAG: nucleotide exchange factor GrpE [Spirochaetaceae bacterium]|jgi:molecular chaperone GrpE|nr:nucleotide exchange factor GrpE [Spirochaetaceae bacterium]
MKDREIPIHEGEDAAAAVAEAVAKAGEAVAGEETRPEAGADAPSTPEERVAALEARCADLEAQIADRNDQYLRKAADFENYRKRMAKEKADAIDFANQSLLVDLIPVLDDFERALKSASDAKNAEGADMAAAFSSFFEGIGMTESRLYSTLENKWGLKRYVSAGEPFDPERHEALMTEQSAETAEPVVQEEFVKGYLLKDRVVRPAKVKVLMPTPPSEELKMDN